MLVGLEYISPAVDSTSYVKLYWYTRTIGESRCLMDITLLSDFHIRSSGS